MKPTYFIHSNHKQMVGAIVAKYSVEKTTKNADKFNIRIIDLDDYPELKRRQGRRSTRHQRRHERRTGQPAATAPAGTAQPQ